MLTFFSPVSLAAKISILGLGVTCSITAWTERVKVFHLMPDEIILGKRPRSYFWIT